MLVPNEIKRGDPILADYLTQITRAIQARTPLDGDQVLWRRTAQGFTPSVLHKGSQLEIFWGKPTGSQTGTINSFTLDPCAIDGTDNGQANLTVNLPSTNIGGRTLATSAIVAYCFDADGDAWVLGRPHKAIVSRDEYTGHIETAYVIGLALTDAINDLEPDIKFGKPTSAFTGNASDIELDPCTADGTDTGEANITADFRALIPDMTAGIDVGGTTDVTGFSVSTSTVIPYAPKNGGYAVIYKDPHPVMIYGPKFDGSGSLYANWVYDFGTFAATGSGDIVMIETEESDTTPCS